MLVSFYMFITCAGIYYRLFQVYGENVMLKEMARCKQCCDETSSVLFLPCRHLCVCLLCSYIVNNCPSCGEHISQRSQYKLDI